MAVKISTAGTEEIMNAVKKMGQKAGDIVNKAVTEGAKPILEEAESLAPRSIKHISRYGEGHMADSIPHNLEKSTGNIRIYSIGWKKDDNSHHFYAKFTEWGTSKMAARPFLYPALNKKRNEAYKIMLRVLAEGLKDE